ncbi:glycine betaine/proline transport system ATP-binding protein [Pseudomonas jinjuensis]|uniref:Quaternary amine transport ATP-binding protein n=2 Tax=Pseudomonas jinjuensis TaxID=198616 RepID=A0A1H0DL89_9PSED|nr:glycine betaine/proline transport system ATP-binding protein [Pseudomonas jinjuensis]
MMSTAPAATAIECRNVWKIFGSRANEALAAIKSKGLGKEEVLDQYGCVVGVADANFSVREGEIFCIMGLSGSGKSTLVRHINRLIEPTAGEILIDGTDINRLNARALRKVRAEKIGMVFQHTALLPHRTVRDNVAFSLELRGVDKATRDRIAREKLALVSLTGWEDRFPTELSGGMQQRVGLARAMAADPRVLLMDEPFSALDPLIRRQLQDQFLQLAAVMKKTTLFITHDLDEAIRIGNRIAIMKDGRVVQIGTPEEIITCPADDYVARFVEGISRLHLVSASSVMQPVERYRAAHGELPADCPIAAPDSDLGELIRLAVSGDRPIVIAANGRTLGVVTTRDLLRGIQGNDCSEPDISQASVDSAAAKVAAASSER